VQATPPPLTPTEPPEPEEVSPPTAEPVSINTPQLAKSILQAKVHLPPTKTKKYWWVGGGLAIWVAGVSGMYMTGQLQEPMQWLKNKYIQPLAVQASPQTAPQVLPEKIEAQTLAPIPEAAAPAPSLETPPVQTVPVRQSTDHPRPTRRLIAAAEDKPESMPRQTGGTLLQGRSAEFAKLELAYSDLTQGRWKEAEQAYSEVLRGNAEEPNALLGLAYIAHQRGQQLNARDYYNRALRQEPGNPVALAGLLALAATGDSPDIAGRVLELAERSPDSAASQSALGHSLVRQGRFAQGQQAFYRAYLLEPFVALHAFNLAVAFDQLQNHMQARSFYERAISLSDQSGGEQASGVSHASVRARLAQLNAAVPATRVGSP
jgi:Flp pilus assembly protein TadD